MPRFITSQIRRTGHSTLNDSFFLVANGVTSADKKRATFLAVIGPSAYRLLRSLISPAKPNEKTYAELVKTPSDHYSPKPSEIVQRCKFYKRFRQPGETVATFLSELCSIAEYCNFGDTLETMLRDRLICGINDDRIQQRLLSEEGDKSTLKSATTLAQAMETAAKDAVELKPPMPHHQTVQRVNKETSKKPCYRCARVGHTPDRCRFKNEKCHQCHKTGHIKRACRSKPQLPRVIKHINEEEPQESASEPDESSEDYNLFALRTTSARRSPIVPVTIESQALEMELDTGADVSLISEETYNQRWKHIPLQESTTTLRSYSGDLIGVKGQMEVNVTYGDQHRKLPLLVVKGKGPNLLGKDWLSRITLK